jgi:biopolymer transport protein ExbD
LLFFLIASTLANPNLVRVNNPRGSKDMKAKQNIIISVNKEHQYFLGQQPIEFTLMDSILKMQIDEARKVVDTPSVVVNADTSAYWGEVFKIMNIAKKYNAKVGVHVK